MSIPDTFEDDVMKLIFNATAITGIADAPLAAGGYTNIAVALSTADPGETGTLATNEATSYNGYARVNVARTTGGWGVGTSAPAPAFPAGTVKPIANIDFPTGGSGGSPTVTNFSVGATGGGDAKAFFTGTVSPSIVCGNGITPRLTTASSITLD